MINCFLLAASHTTVRKQAQLFHNSQQVVPRRWVPTLTHTLQFSHLQEVPVLHEVVDGQATLHALAQHVVDLDDVLR